MYKKFLKIALCFIIPIIITVVLSFFGAIMVLKTEISQNTESLFSIIAVSIGCMAMSIMMVFNTKLKGIYCVVVSFIYYFIIKFFVTLLIEGKIALTGQGILNIIFMLLFCFIGGIIGSNIKK